MNPSSGKVNNMQLPHESDNLEKLKAVSVHIWVNADQRKHREIQNTYCKQEEMSQ